MAVAAAIATADIGAHPHFSINPAPVAIYAKPTAKLKYNTKGTIFAVEASVPYRSKRAFPPETSVAIPNRSAIPASTLITKFDVQTDTMTSPPYSFRKAYYRSNLKACLPPLRPTYPFSERTSLTHRSGSSAPGLRHRPSGVGRHFGDRSMIPPVIFPVPFWKSTRVPTRPSSVVIFHGCPSVILWAGDGSSALLALVKATVAMTSASHDIGNKKRLSCMLPR